MATTLAQSPLGRNESGAELRILVRGTNWLGDAVMTTPALLRLRERFPAAHIALLTPEKLADLWVAHPAVDEIIRFGAGDGLVQVAAKLRLKALRQRLDVLRSPLEEPGRKPNETVTEAVVRQASGLVRFYRDFLHLLVPSRNRRHFDVALVLPNSARSALEVFFAGIPIRIGYRRPWRNFFLTQTIRLRPGSVKMHKRSTGEIRRLVAGPEGIEGLAGRTVPVAAHQTHEYLHLAAALGAGADPLPPQLFVTPQEVAAVRKKFGLDAVSGPILGLNPGAEYGPAKRWPPERFAAVAREIQQQTAGTWILFGGRNDQALTAQIQSALGRDSATLNLAGQTTLRELMGLLKLCRVLLTNDTGPMHVAAALGTPVVVPFGSTSPELTGPGLPGDARHRLLKSNVPCAPCFLRQCPIDFRCLQGLMVDRVVAAVRETLAEDITGGG
jgi:heptosyltransferase-2